MTLTTAQAFDPFLTRISPTDGQRAEITNKWNSTERYLREAFPPSSTLPLKRVIPHRLSRPRHDHSAGQRRRRPRGVHRQGPHLRSAIPSRFRGLLQRIGTALNARTSIKKIGARGQAVRLFYVNGAHVDIAPVFKWDKTSGGSDCRKVTGAG